MKFLDEIGLASFWKKIKNWVNINYLSLKGGTINGNINISGNVSALQFKKTNGTSTQVLIADGSVKGIGSANGIAGLDANGYVPLAQLGNLDTTVAEVVTALPTTNIKKHIYLIKDASGVTQNQYEEYIYTGDTSATYDASKWEKLGDFRATVDLADYAKKNEAVHGATASHTPTSIYVKLEDVNYNVLGGFEIFGVTSENAGLMLPSFKNKLDLFDTSKVTSSIDVAKLLTVDYKGIIMKREASRLTVVLNTLDKSSSSLDFTAASPNIAGLMSGADKTKLNGIASGATADSAIPISVIDALN
jgi:hypothetical protein